MGDLERHALTLEKWADVLDIPSGPFVNEDLRLAAAALRLARGEALEEAAMIAERRHDLELPQTDGDYQLGYRCGMEGAQRLIAERIRSLAVPRDGLEHAVRRCSTPSASAPDWPPRISAIGLADGEQKRGSTGQLFEARCGQWVRVHEPPSASAPDGRLEMAPLCIGWTTLDELCRKPHMVDVGPGLIAADDLLADPPVRASARPPAIDGQAWPSEEQRHIVADLALSLRHYFEAAHGKRAKLHAEISQIVFSELWPLADALYALLAAAPPAQGSAQVVTERRPGRSRLVYDKTKRTIVTVVEPPAQGSAGWTPSDDDLRAGVRAFQSTPHGPDYLADWRAFYEAVRALAPPVEAQGSERMPVEKSKLLAMRDALIAKDIEEAYHVLYSIADPLFESRAPWAALGDSSPATENAK